VFLDVGHLVSTMSLRLTSTEMWGKFNFGMVNVFAICGSFVL